MVPFRPLPTKSGAWPSSESSFHRGPRYPLPVLLPTPQVIESPRGISRSEVAAAAFGEEVVVAASAAAALVPATPKAARTVAVARAADRFTGGPHFVRGWHGGIREVRGADREVATNWQIPGSCQKPARILPGA